MQLKNLRSAVSFFTILPLGKPPAFKPEAMTPLFPLVGLIIGGLLAFFDLLVARLWPAPVGAVLDVVFLVAITGAFHLDGLGDTADGIFSHRSKERALEIMKDSRLGTMGLVAIVCILAIKVSGLAAIGQDRFLALLIVPAYARAGILFGIRYLPYGRPQGGTGSEFFRSPLPLASHAWLLVPVFLSLFLGLKGLIINLVFFGTVTGMILFYKRRLNCITGDMLGAMVEVTEAGLFLVFAVGTGF